jgi:tetratricopeptide (TPR) repeat protein
MERGMKRSAVDRFNVAIRIATQSRDPEDLARAEALYRQREAEFGVSSPNAMQRIENLGGMMTIRRLQGDQAGSAAVLEEMLQVYADHLDFSFGRNIVHTRLAELWLFDQQRSEDAEGLARRVMTDDVEALGEGLVTARGAYLLARALLHQGRIDEARAALDQATAIHARHAGGAPPPTEYRLARLLLTLEAGSGAATESDVDRQLVEFRDHLSTLPADSPWSTTLALAERYAQARMDPDSVRELRDQMPERPAVELEAIYLHTRLLEALADRDAGIRGQ